MRRLIGYSNGNTRLEKRRRENDKTCTRACKCCRGCRRDLYYVILLSRRYKWQCRRKEERRRVPASRFHLRPTYNGRLFLSALPFLFFIDLNCIFVYCIFILFISLTHANFYFFNQHYKIKQKSHLLSYSIYTYFYIITYSIDINNSKYKWLLEKYY